MKLLRSNYKRRGFGAGKLSAITDNNKPIEEITNSVIEQEYEVYTKKHNQIYEKIENLETIHNSRNIEKKNEISQTMAKYNEQKEIIINTCGKDDLNKLPDRLEKFQHNINDIAINFEGKLSSVCDELIHQLDRLANETADRTIENQHINFKSIKYNAGEYVRNFGQILLLLVTIFYDLVVTYKVVNGFIEGEYEGFWISEALIAGLITVFVMIILLGVVRYTRLFSFRWLTIKKEDGYEPFIAGIFGLAVLFLYISMSIDPDLQMSEIFNREENKDLLELVMRLLVIPALVIGDMMMDQIQFSIVGKPLIQFQNYVTNIIKSVRMQWNKLFIQLVERRKAKSQIENLKIEYINIIQDVVNSEKGESGIGLTSVLSQIDSIREKIADIEIQKDREIQMIENRYAQESKDIEKRKSILNDQLDKLSTSYYKIKTEVSDGVRLGILSVKAQ